MREIKFRAWDKKMKKIYDLEKVIGFEISDFLNPRGDKEDLILMQYTGLKDKNGKEIYDGDIVKEPDDWGCSTPNYEVRMEGGCWWLYQGKYCYDSEVGIQWDEYEVIGNIYENPELLNN